MKRDRSDSEQRTIETTYLTAEEVSERYRGEITVGTLRNWRSLRIGPNFVKHGKAVLYPLDGLTRGTRKISWSAMSQKC
jgi:hypothetical protein